MNMKLMEAELPIGWTWQRISDKFRVTKKPRDLDLSTFDVIPFVPMDAVPVNGCERVAYELRAPAQIASGTYFEKGDVLLSKITPSFENGKQGFANNAPGAFGVASTEIIPLQGLDGAANSRFLFYYLLHPEVRAILAGKMEGSTGRQRVPEHVVCDFPFPVPPRSEQEKIAAILLKVRRTIDVEERLIATARELKQSAMHELFTRGLRNERQKETELGPLPDSWKVIPLGVLGRIGNGSTPLKRNAAYWTHGTIPWLTSAKVYDVTVTTADQFVTDAAFRECHLPRVKPGSVLIAITGQGKTLGHAAVTAIETCVSQHIAYVQFADEATNPHFVRLFLESRYDHLRAIAQGGGSTKGALTCGFLKTYVIPFPQRSEQNDIASALMAIEKNVCVHERKRATLQELFKTLLHQLMTGDIRVTDLDIDVSEIALQ